MNKSFFVFAFLMYHSVFIYAQMGNNFPVLKGETLSKKLVNLPIDTKGKFTLLGLAYSQKAEQDLQTWFQPVFTTFIEKPKPGLFNDSYDINLYFIPMFTGVNQGMADKATRMLNDKLDKNLVPYVLIYKGEIQHYKEPLNLIQNDVPYFFLLDKNGKIIHSTSGKYSDEKMEKIESLMEE